MFHKIIGKACKNTECEFKDKLKEDFNVMCDCGHALEDVTATDKPKIIILCVIIVVAISGGAYYSILMLKEKARQVVASGAIAAVKEGRKAINDIATNAPTQPSSAGITVSPADAKAAITLVSEGLNLAKTNKFQEAAEKFNQATTKDNSNDQAWGNLGAAYVAMGKHADALVPTKKATEINPKNENWHLNLAEINSVTGNKKEALSELELAIKSGFADKSKLKSFNFKAIENEPKFKEIAQEK